MKYERPNMLILELKEDVITTSGGDEEKNEIGWGQVGGSFGEEFPLQ